MTKAVIRELRRLEGRGLVTASHCIRAERFVERHPEIFSDPTTMTVRQAVDLAVESARLPN